MRERLPKGPDAPPASGVASLVVLPGAREAFAPRELAAAFEDFVAGEPQFLDAETGVKASAYLFDARELLVYEEPETSSIVLFHPTS